ncbi:MAG TPA: hypothetical protein VGH10_02030 [Actinomycetota bacterium]
MDTKSQPNLTAPTPARERRWMSRRWILVLAALFAVMAVAVGIGELWASRVANAPMPPALQRALDGGARLGSNEPAFVSALGQPTLAGAMMGNLRTDGFARCDGTRVDQVQVAFASGVAVSIRFTPCGTAPPAPSRFAQTQRFLPADASSHPATFVSGLGDTAYRVTSATLARRVAPIWFQDCNGRDVPPGTASFGMTRQGGWDLTTGTCPQLG